MFRKFALAACAAICANCSSAHAVKSLRLSIDKAQSLVIEIPPSEWAKKETSWSSGIPISVLHVDAEMLHAKRWQNGQLPLLAEFHIEKAQDCGSGALSGRIVGCPPSWKQVELRSTSAWLKLQFPPEVDDVESALREVTFVGSVNQFEASDYLHDKVFLPNQAFLFSATPSLAEADRYLLFRFGVTNGVDVSSSKFKDTTYVLLLVPSTTTFNTIRMNQDERVSTVIKETVLPRAKAVLPLVTGKPVEGVAFRLSVPAYNFVTGGEVKFDDLVVYLNIERLKAFAQSDITSQQLVSQSFVLLNGDRIEAKL